MTPKIGIFGVSGQSGKAYFADLLSQPVEVYGYARPSDHGRETVDAIRAQGGVHLERPANVSSEASRFVPLGLNQVGHDLAALVEGSDLLLLTHPSVYHEATVAELAPLLARRAKPLPIVLSPSRTLASPYVWEILGEGYPIVAFQTCPYACKSYAPGSVFIKRRKKAWTASLEGRVAPETRVLLQRLFPQIILTNLPAVTSLGNIGAVFHPTAYLMNLEAIQAAAARGETFSFYMDGIANNPVVGPLVGEIDQIRLRIAAAAGLSVFGLEEDPREGEWEHLMERMRSLETAPSTDPRVTRRLRSRYLQALDESVVSAQHWLAYTYGVWRQPGETLASAIGRNPSFQANSVPQARYADEDVPTGLVPLEALAHRFGVDATVMTRVIDRYDAYRGTDIRSAGRNLEGFSTDALRRYLRGDASGLAVRQWHRSAS